jgi:hypothetical protein
MCGKKEKENAENEGNFLAEVKESADNEKRPYP